MLLLILLSEDIFFPLYHDLEAARRIVYMPRNEVWIIQEFQNPKE